MKHIIIVSLLLITTITFGQKKFNSGIEVKGKGDIDSLNVIKLLIDSSLILKELATGSETFLKVDANGKIITGTGDGAVKSGPLLKSKGDTTLVPYNADSAPDGSFYYNNGGICLKNSLFYVNSVDYPAYIGISTNNDGIRVYTTNGLNNAKFGNTGDSVTFPRTGSIMRGYRSGSEVFSISNKGFIRPNNNGYNISVGSSSMYGITTGQNNAALGHESLNSLTTGNGNVSIGAYSLKLTTTTSYNTAIGESSLTDNRGTGNTAIGSGSLGGNQFSSYNTGIGYGSLNGNISGSNNIAIGYSAGTWNNSNSNRLYINSLGRTNLLGDTTKSIIYGYQNVTVANQRLYLNATTHTGNIEAGNYTKFESDGSIVYNGTATYWEDVNIAGSALGAGASAPDLITVNSTVLQTRAFDGGAISEQLFDVIELPHSYKEGSNITVHIHWMPTTTGTGNVKWNVDYQWVNAGDVYGSTVTTISGITAATGTAWDGTNTDIATISGTGKTISSHFMFRLYRDPTDVLDTYTGDASLIVFGIHVECDRPGSRTITTK